MTFVLLLAALALLDATTMGTLLIPLWLLLDTAAFRARRILLYLGVVASAYFAIGLVLLWAAVELVRRYADFWESAATSRILFSAGVALLLGGILLEIPAIKKSREARRHQRQTGTVKPPLTQRLRTKALTAHGPGPIIGLAGGAVAVELATMWPYLIAIGLIATNLSGFTASLALAGYCFIMVLPALLLLIFRVGAPDQANQLLKASAQALSKPGVQTTGMIVIGIILIVNNLAATGWFF